MAYHLLLSARSRRGIGFACSWSSDGGGAVQCLAIAVEDHGPKTRGVKEVSKESCGLKVVIFFGEKKTNYFFLKGKSSFDIGELEQNYLHIYIHI